MKSKISPYKNSDYCFFHIGHMTWILNVTEGRFWRNCFTFLVSFHDSIYSMLFSLLDLQIGSTLAHHLWALTCSHKEKCSISEVYQSELQAEDAHVKPVCIWGKVFLFNALKLWEKVKCVSWFPVLCDTGFGFVFWLILSVVRGWHSLTHDKYKTFISFKYAVYIFRCMFSLYSFSFQ